MPDQSITFSVEEGASDDGTEKGQYDLLVLGEEHDSTVSCPCTSTGQLAVVTRVLGLCR